MANFRERYGPWYEGGQSEDRRNEPWPWHQLAQKDPQQTLTDDALRERSDGWAASTGEVPSSPLGLAAGLNDVKPPSSAELLKFLIDIEMANANPEPLKRMNDPIKRR